MSIKLHEYLLDLYVENLKKINEMEYDNVFQPTALAIHCFIQRVVVDTEEEFKIEMGYDKKALKLINKIIKNHNSDNLGIIKINNIDNFKIIKNEFIAYLKETNPI